MKRSDAKKRMELAALAWKGGVSYGKFAQNLTQKERKLIVQEYMDMIAEREQEQQERLDEYREEKTLRRKRRSAMLQKGAEDIVND